MRRAIIACGGTGGHMSPGIALAEEMIARGWRCTLLISNKQVDSRLVRKYVEFDYETIDGRPFAMRPDRLVQFLVSLVRGTVKCRRIIKRDKPDLVIGFGGFLSMPALLAGFLSGLPTAIHEANRVAGRVTRIVSRFAKRIYLPQDVALSTNRGGRIRFLGMPVRREISVVPKSDAKKALGLDPKQRVLVVMGGSQGADSLNRWAKESLESLAEGEVQVYCLTGSSEEDSEKVFRSSNGAEVKSAFRRFSDEMAIVLSAADLVVSRSGAGSIAEMIRCRVPGILIPYPFSADDHQVANAEEFVRLGCGVQIPQDKIVDLLDEVKTALFSDETMRRFSRNLELADRADIEAFMVSDLEGIISGVDFEDSAQSKVGSRV